MSFRDLVLRNRSCRRFRADVPVAQAMLLDLVDLARCTPSAGNKQPLKYIMACDPVANAKIFPCLFWAAYLQDWQGPKEGERPAAYIVMLGDTRIASSFGCDQGIAAQTIMLGATELGLAGCIVASIDRHKLRTALGILDQFEILLVLALGKAGETIMLEPINDGNIRYWRDAQDQHHVPKRSLKEITVEVNS
jgi:nitroreductase